MGVGVEVSPPPPTVPPVTTPIDLSLSPHGTGRAGDDEMADVSGAGGSASGDSLGTPRSLLGASTEAEVGAAPEPTDRQQQLTGQKRKRKERKKRSKERAKQREAVRVSAAKSEKEDGDASSQWRVPDTVTQEVPARLVADPELQSEYARRLAAIADAGGVVSIGTFRKLSMMIEEDLLLMEMSGRDWASTYQKLPHVEVRVCISDADLPVHDDCSEEDGDDIDYVDDL